MLGFRLHFLDDVDQLLCVRVAFQGVELRRTHLGCSDGFVFLAIRRGDVPSLSFKSTLTFLVDLQHPYSPRN